MQAGKGERALGGQSYWGGLFLSATTRTAGAARHTWGPGQAGANSNSLSIMCQILTCDLELLRPWEAVGSSSFPWYLRRPGGHAHQNKQEVPFCAHRVTRETLQWALVNAPSPPASLNARVPPFALPGPSYLPCAVSEATSLEALESGLCRERLRHRQRRSSRAPGCATWPGGRPPSRLASHMEMLCF